jgi:hypothetical protein
VPTTKELLAQLAAARKVQRAAEQPVREARRKITYSLSKAREGVHRANQLLADELRGQAVGFGGWHLREREQHAAGQIARYNEVLSELQTFDLLHGIDAEYSVAPEVDREATVAEAKAERRRAIEHLVREHHDHR